VTAPHRTPNPATQTRPERSSKKVTRKSPLGWLPWALLGLLALLLLLTLLLVSLARGDDGGSDAGSAGSAGDTGAAQGQTGGGNGGSVAEGDLAGLSERALVGGGAVPAGPAGQAAGAEALAQQPGTAGAVLFAEASAEIDQQGQQVIRTAAENLRSAGATSVEVVGHTDEVAGDPVNDTLSQERADAVAAALRTELPGVDVTASARGQEEPLAGNDTEEGRQLNRRAVITATS
jgi:outer membrane protein OmpA-like peptidoglycan-associated protein